jgi:hypothetical protein
MITMLLLVTNAVVFHQGSYDNNNVGTFQYTSYGGKILVACKSHIENMLYINTCLFVSSYVSVK